MFEFVGVVMELFCWIFGMVGEGLEKWTGKPAGCLIMVVAFALSGLICYLLVVLALALAR
jgi:hypothetical protein